MMNYVTKNYAASPVIYCIGFLAAASLFTLGALSYHGAEAVLLKRLMGSLVLGLNLSCLLLLHYEHLKSLGTKKLLHDKYECMIDHDMIDELRVLTPLEFNAILQHYRTVTPQLLGELEVAIARRLPEEMMRLSRRLRSSSLQIGAAKFAVLAQEIEYHAAMGKLRQAVKICKSAAQTYDALQVELIKIQNLT